MFGSNNFLKKGKGINGMMSMMFKINMLKSLMGGEGSGNMDANGMLGMMMMSNMLSGKNGEEMDLSEMFDFDFEEANFDPTEEKTEETPAEKKARLKKELAALEAEEDK